MRNRYTFAAFATASFVLLTGCAGPAETDSSLREPPAAVASATGSEQGRAEQLGQGGTVHVTANGNSWDVVVLDTGPADLGDIVQYGSSRAAAVPEHSRIDWVCATITQTSGQVGTWVGEDFQFLWLGADGTRFDQTSAIDFAMEAADRDIYFVKNHPLGQPYENVCTLFVVPEEATDFSVVIAPDDGEDFTVIDE